MARFTSGAWELVKCPQEIYQMVQKWHLADDIQYFSCG